jgi:radical SAM superfamily enzyme YgiQ (UPF0313 family)
LRDTRCDGIGIGVEAGSEWFRRNVLRRTLSNDRLIEAFKLIHEYGIRTTANAMIAFPGEDEEDILETIRLISSLEPKSFDASFVTAYSGTDIHKVAVKLGYVDVLDEPGFRGMVTDLSFRGRSTIRNPLITPERLSDIYMNFNEYVSGKRPLPPARAKERTSSERSMEVADAMRTLHT